MSHILKQTCRFVLVCVTFLLLPGIKRLNAGGWLQFYLFFPPFLKLFNEFSPHKKGLELFCRDMRILKLSHKMIPLTYDQIFIFI